MRNYFKLATLAAILLCSFAAVSCKGSKVEPGKKYNWTLIRVHENYVSDPETHTNDVLSWVNTSFTQIKSQIEGEGTFSNDNQLSVITSTAEQAVLKVISDFKELEKTYDFGGLEYKGTYQFQVTKEAADFYKGPEMVLEYKALTRLESKVDFVIPNLSKLMAASQEFSTLKSFNYDELKLSSDQKMVVAGDSRIYKLESREVYTGTPFVKKVSMNDTNLSISVAFSKEHLSEYLGTWYILVPLAAKDTTEPVIESMIKIVLE